jgi:cell division protein FtsN
VLFEKNDVPNACAANARALSQADAAEIELKNQIQYQGQRCPVVVVSVEQAASAAVVSTGATAAVPVAVAPEIPAAAVAPVVPAAAVPSPVAVAAAVAEPSRAAKQSAAIAYSVQVAAYTRQGDAENLASTLAKRGYAARVDGSAAPFRVRIGRYATRNDAEDALKKIKSKHMDSFVVRAPER